MELAEFSESDDPEEFQAMSPAFRGYACRKQGHLAKAREQFVHPHPSSPEKHLMSQEAPLAPAPAEEVDARFDSSPCKMTVEYDPVSPEKLVEEV